MRSHRLCALMIAAVMTAVLIMPVFTVSADENSINIYNAEQLAELAKKCTLDSWSHGKTVTLKSDIDISKLPNLIIPTFGGTFNGEGHTVSGVSINKSGASIGLFRYIQKDGKVSELNVKGEIIPDGTRGTVGTIAADNSGTIAKCSFEGTVKGKNIVGGIVGTNNTSGKIYECTASGTVTGESMTGGIAGKNAGNIIDCINKTNVNTTHEEKAKNTEDIDADFGSTLEKLEINAKENEETKLPSSSDTGGIAGYTDGIIQGSKNYGKVGYAHVGYNIGGIAGRQSGYILSCENHGEIYGRKDVGGIVGQAEPYVILDSDGNELGSVEAELDNLHNMVNSLINDADETTGSITSHLKKISDYAGNAKNDTNVLSNEIKNRIDNAVDGVNTSVADISDMAKDISDAFTPISQSTDLIKAAITDISEALNEIEIENPELSEAVDALQSALLEIDSMSSSLLYGIQLFNDAFTYFQNALVVENPSQVIQAFSDMEKALTNIKKANETQKKAIDNIRTILKNNEKGFENIIPNIQNIITELDGLSESVKTVSDNLETAVKCIQNITDNVSVDFGGYKDLKTAMRDIRNALSEITSAIRILHMGLKGIYESVDMARKALDGVTSDIEEAVTKISDATKSMADAVDGISESVNLIQTAVNKFTESESFTFEKTSDNYNKTSESLFNELDNISREISSMTDSADKNADTVNSRLRAINNQFSIITHILEDKANNIKSDKDIIIDVSEEDINNSKQGKTEGCKNYAKIEADRNVGGIVGAMSVEYALDPEDDNEKPSTWRFTYRTKAIVQKCVNDGKITGKKDCIGGVVGWMDLGTVYNGESYNDVSSENGSYIGGIAGRSDSSVRKSYSKGKIIGKKYVGGIAGNGDMISDCCSITEISGTEAIGAVAGNIKSISNIRNNLFVDNGTGGIDEISYALSAKPVTYDELRDMTDVPDRLISFWVKFIADGEVITEAAAKYGDSIETVTMPKIPDRDGCFGKWKESDVSVIKTDMEIEAEYIPYVTVLASEEMNESGKLALMLAEGEFTDEARLTVGESDEQPPEIKNIKSEVKVWKVKLSNTDLNGTSDIPVRILNENHDRVKVYQMLDNKWKELEATSRGKYVKLNIHGNNASVCVVYEPSPAAIGRFIIIFISVLVLIGVLFKMLVAKRKKIKVKRS